MKLPLALQRSRAAGVDVDMRVPLESLAKECPSEISSDVAASLSSYRIPKVAEDGSCSLPDVLEPEPFQVLDALRKAAAPNSNSSDDEVGKAQLRRLYTLKEFCKRLQELTKSDWVGVYERFDSGNGYEQLMKLAYVGAPSRPYFPLTAEFASHSNNSTVAMTTDAIVIHDVRAMSKDTPYYTCDGKVRAEVCAPIVAADGVCIGIIDVEKFKAGWSESDIDAILNACQQLADHDLLRAAF